MPALARGVFSEERLPLVVRYAELLATQGVLRGLIGPRETPRLWERHLLNCAVLEDQLPQGCSVGDIGSGAGLPGIVIALARPDVTVTLVEPLLRRTTFLEEVVAELGLDVRVVRGRAEDLHGGPGFDVVTSRAVAPLGRLLDWSMPLVRPSGALIAMKGSSVAAEIAEAASTVRAWGTTEPEVLELGASLGIDPTFAVRVAWADPASLSWPPTRSGATRRAPAPGKARASTRGSRGKRRPGRPT